MPKKAKKNKTGRANVQSGNFAHASDGLNGNRVFVSVAKTINLGNYESLRLEFGMGKTLEDGDKYSECFEDCLNDCSKELKETLELMGQIKKKGR